MLKSTYRATKILLLAKGGTILIAGVTITLPATLTHVTVTPKHYSFDGTVYTQVFNTLDSVELTDVIVTSFTYETGRKSLATLNEIDTYFSRKLSKDEWTYSTNAKRRKAIYMATELIDTHTFTDIPDAQRIEAVARLTVKYLGGWVQSDQDKTSFAGITEVKGDTTLAPRSWPDVRAYQILVPYASMKQPELHRT